MKEMELQEVKHCENEWRQLEEERTVGMVDMILGMEKKMQGAKESVKHSVVELAKDAGEKIQHLVEIVDEQILICGVC